MLLIQRTKNVFSIREYLEHKKTFLQNLDPEDILTAQTFEDSDDESDSEATNVNAVNSLKKKPMKAAKQMSNTKFSRKAEYCP